MRKYIIFLLFVLIASCQEEIEFDYRTVDKIYVVEGNLTDESMQVYITATRNMDDNRKDNTINNAVVQLTTDKGYSETLFYGNDGYYRSSSGIRGVSGTTYRLAVSIEDKDFFSESTMHNKLQIDSVGFQKYEIFFADVMVCRINFIDGKNEDNFYMYRIYRNNELYSWSIFTDKGHDGETMTVNLRLRMKDDSDDLDDFFIEGDNVDIELHVINKAIYDYYYSLSLSESTSSNPINNFDGGCLGYFSAHPVTYYSFVFSEDLAE